MNKDLKEILEYKLIDIGKYDIQVSTLLLLLLFTFGLILFLQIVKRIVSRIKSFDKNKKHTIISLSKYLGYMVYIIGAMQILGFNISVLMAGSAALLVGIGLGLQNIFSDFVSGVVILLDTSVKVNDVIEVNGLVCQVQEINLRTTTVLTRDDKYIILPNTDLTKNHIINWTLHTNPSRFEITVGVDYSSNPQQVIEVITNVARAYEKIEQVPEPFVRFNDYADSALIFTLYFWSYEMFRIENYKSDLRVRIFKALQAEKIGIPFPQRVVHLKTKPSASDEA